jgi:hypothetical protein
MAQLGRAGRGRLNDEFLVVTTEQAETASRPSGVQSGQVDFVEPVDHIRHGVLVSLHQLGDHRHAGFRRPRPAASSRAGSAPN